MCIKSSPKEEMNFRRQGQSTRITITGGETVDRYDIWQRIMGTVNHQPIDFDFQITKDEIIIFAHPWAVNG